MSDSSKHPAGSDSRPPSIGDKVATGAAFALGAAVVSGVLAFIVSGGNPVVALAVASKVGTAAGIGGAAGGNG